MRDPLETVEKVAKPLFRVRLHEIFASISCEIVGKNFARSVISEAHVPENDEISFYSVVCGRRNSLQEGFFDKLRRVPHMRDPLFLFFSGLISRQNCQQHVKNG